MTKSQINIKDNQHDTPLTLSFTRGMLQVTLKLIDLGCDVSTTASINNLSPLFLACKYGHKRTKERMR